MEEYSKNLKFKHKKDLLHFDEGRLDLRLRVLVHATAEYTSDLRRSDHSLPVLVVTDTLRTPKDMLGIYGDIYRKQGIPESGIAEEVAKRKSPHLENRAVDFRAQDWTPETMGKIKDFIETHFRHYGVAVLIHDTGKDLTNGKISTGIHYHVSLKPIQKGLK